MPLPWAYYSKVRFHFRLFSATCEADPDKSIGNKPMLAILITNVISLWITKKLIENSLLVHSLPYTATHPTPTQLPGSRSGEIPNVNTNTTLIILDASM